LPETEAAEQAYRFAGQIEPAFVLAHSRRSYSYARELAGRGPFQELSTASPRDLHPNLHAISIWTVYRPHPPTVD
jgi:hypothetical protein